MNKIDGKIVAMEIQNNLQKQLENIPKDKRPCIGIIIVGNRTDSETYVRLKIKKCNELNINHKLSSFSNNITEDELIEQIELFNNDKNINGILLQLPLPKHINERKILNIIDYHKDIEWFSRIKSRTVINVWQTIFLSMHTVCYITYIRIL